MHGTRISDEKRCGEISVSQVVLEGRLRQSHFPFYPPLDWVLAALQSSHIY